MATSGERVGPTTPPMEALLSSLQDGFEVLDADGTILDANERFAEIVGRPREEIVGLRPPFPWWSESDAPRIQDAMRSVLAGGAGEFDFTFQRPDGELLRVILNATSVRDPWGNLNVVATLKDVSDRAAAQAEREELIRTLSTERAQLSRVLERMGRIQRFTASIAPLMREDEIVTALLSAAWEAVTTSSAAIVPPSSSPDDAGDLGEAFRSGSSRWPGAAPGGEEEGWGFVPIVGPEGSIGVLAVSSPEGGITWEDRDTIETMVRQAAQALERARLYTAESRTRITLARVLNVSDAALEWMESDDALQALLSRIREAVGADSASLLVREGDRLRVRATDGLERIPGEQPLVPIGHGFAGRIAAARQAIVAEDLSQIDVVSPWLRSKLRSVAGVPILRGDGVIGVLHVGTVSARRFDRDDLALLNLVATRVGGALERAQLYEAAREARAENARAADRLRRLQTATASLTGAMNVSDVSESILREAIGAMQADAGVLAVPSEDGRWLEVVSTMGKRATGGRFTRRFRVDDANSISEAYRTGATVWVPTRAEWEHRFPEGLGADKPWARSVLAIPLSVRDERLGAIGLMFRTEGRLGRDERRLAKSFAEQAALAFERARLFEDERAARETTERLHEFASALSAVASADEVLSILIEDGRRLVGAGAAWAAVLDVGTQELRAAAQRGYEGVMAGFEHLPLDSPMPASDAAREGREIWFDSLERFDRAYPEFQRPSAERGGGFGCLPMFDASRTVIGVACFQLDHRGAISSRQRSSMRAIVALCAQSLERAQLYERERTVAATLQKSLLPGSLPEERRVRVATRYRPGTQDLDIGGDWYDVIHVEGDRIGVAVGDVVGHGLEAASAMGQLRSALRSLALMGDGPAAVIHGLDRFARTTGPATVATLAYAELDLRTDTLRYACAGHPPPFVVIGRRVDQLMEGRTTPLAALPEAPSAEEGVHAFPPGSTLLLYSDGLIERRGEPLDVGMERLRALLADTASEDAEHLADIVLEALTGEVPQDDDVALLCLRTVADPGPLSVSVPAEPSALVGLRADVRGWLTAQAIPEDVHADVVLACDEACANAIEHAYRTTTSRPIRVELRREDDRVVIQVEDAGTWRDDLVEGDRGRGISIMRAVMDDVDIRTDRRGTVVTLRRRVHGPDRPAAAVPT